MKRFIIVSLLLMSVGRSLACVSEKPTYNYYLMCVESAQQQTENKQLMGHRTKRINGSETK